MPTKNHRMHHHHNNNVVEEGHHHHEALMMYQTYPPPPPCAYFVQSPSTTLQNDAESTSHSPVRSDAHPANQQEEEEVGDPTRFALYRYSSRGSTAHSFLHHKKVSYDGSHTTAAAGEGDVNRLANTDGKGEDEDEDDEEEGLIYNYDEYYDDDGKKNRGGAHWKRYLSYRNSDSWGWIWLQLSWRVAVSFGVALLVFYFATKPPPPNLSIQIARMAEFKLAEGVDRTGVTTKILSVNCSMNLIVENKSRFFGLHIRPPIMDMKFSTLPFAFSHGPELYAEGGLTIFTLQLGVKNKFMYGAGRSMQDMLDSGAGLPILIRVGLTSCFNVVPSLIKPKFHHNVECVVVLNKAYNKKHRTQVFGSTCKVTS